MQILKITIEIKMNEMRPTNPQLVREGQAATEEPHRTNACTKIKQDLLSQILQ